MGVGESVLGFDARTLDPALRKTWDERRRARFLLRTDAKMPLSTDVLVWPSAWTALSSPGDIVSAPQGLATLQNDLNALQSRIRSNDPGVRFSVIAITLPTVNEQTTNELERLKRWAAISQPETVEVQLAFLGYDVSDGSLLSAVTNCPHPSKGTVLSQVEWGPYLNRYHLFSDIEAALRFQQVVNVQLPSHAPFFVFGLYRFPTDGQLIQQPAPEEEELGQERGLGRRTHSSCYMACMEQRAESQQRAYTAFETCSLQANNETERAACAHMLRQEMEACSTQFMACTAQCE